MSQSVEAAVYHDVVTSQQLYGWRAVCAGCPWRYENTSPAITLRAAQLHGVPAAATADTASGQDDADGR